MTNTSIEPTDRLTVLLLAGGIAPSPVAEATGRPLWTLSIRPETTVLDRWIDTLHTMGEEEPPRIRLLVSGALLDTQRTFVRCRGVEPIVDSNDYRGPAGVLRDACDDLHENDLILAGEVARCPMVALSPIVQAHAERQNDVTVVSNPDGSPAGLYACRVGVLRETLASRGYTDIKEQWLPALRAEGRRVAVHRLDEPGVLPLRTPREFLDVLRANGSSPDSDLDRAFGHQIRVVAPGVAPPSRRSQQA